MSQELDAILGAIIGLVAIVFAYRVLSRAKVGKPPFEFKRRSDRTIVRIYEIGDSRGYFLPHPTTGKTHVFKFHSAAVEWCHDNDYEPQDD